MNSSSECGICFGRYDERIKIPKNLPCGHVKCLDCLRQSKLVAVSMRNTSKCPECSTPIPADLDNLPTNYTILQDAIGTANMYHCDICNKVADFECEKKNHPFRALWAHRKQQTESSRKAVETWSGVLEKVVPKVLQLRDIAEEELNATMAAQNKADTLTKRLKAFINGTAGPGADQENTMRDAGECSLRLPPLERGLRFLQLDAGLCRMELQDGGETWAASLTLGGESSVKPEILAVAQYLAFLLCKEGHMQKQQKAAPKPRPKAAAAAGDGPVRGPGPSRQDRQDRQVERPQSSTPRPAWTISDGVLDLRPKGEVGEMPLGPQDKTAILKSTAMVTHIIGSKCNEDPDFYAKIIIKHAPYIENLELRQVHQRHLDLLGTMQRLKDLKLLGYQGTVSVGMLPQPGCVLRSLFLKLPTNVQFGLWEVYAASLSNIVLRIEVSTLNIHNKLRTLAAKTPNLRTLRLSRYNDDEHTTAECAKQMAAIRGVVPTAVIVSCSKCS